MKEKKENEFYYVYKLTNPITGEFYFGSRKSKKQPHEDYKYLGSMKTWIIDKSVLVKTIIKSDFKSHEECVIYESEIIRLNINDILNRNYNIPNVGFYTKGKNCGGDKNSFYGKKHSEEHKKLISNLTKGNKNPSYGKKWVNNGKDVLYIKKEELDYYLNNGWVLGNLKVKEKNSLFGQKRKWINDGYKMLYVLEEKLDEYLDNNWVLGRIITDNMIKSFKTIGEKSKGRINKYGYKLKNLRWISNNGVNKRVYLSDLDDYLKNGWVLGRSSSLGENNKNTNLTQIIVDDIRNKYLNGFSIKELVKTFSKPSGSIQGIIYNKTWKDNNYGELLNKKRGL
jgi:hypothetical protein